MKLQNIGKLVEYKWKTSQQNCSPFVPLAVDLIFQDTAVRGNLADGKSKSKAAAKGKDAEAEADKAAIRTSGRVRKPAKKALHVIEDAAPPLKKAAVPASENRKTRARRA